MVGAWWAKLLLEGLTVGMVTCALPLPSPPAVPVTALPCTRPTRAAASCQVEVVGRVDEQLRKEMVEAQSQVARWITEQKQVADMVTLQKQRLLENDKGASLLAAARVSGRALLRRGAEHSCSQGLAPLTDGAPPWAGREHGAAAGGPEGHRVGRRGSSAA